MPRGPEEKQTPELGGDAAWGEHEAALGASTGEQIGRAGDDTSGPGHRGFLLSQRKARFRGVMTSWGGA